MKMIRHPEELSARRGEGHATVARYDVVMRLSVENIDLLWKAAAAHALTFRECAECDVEDMLGPIEDPFIADCIAMLIRPPALDGCGCEAFEILPVEFAVGSSAGRKGGAQGADEP